MPDGATPNSAESRWAEVVVERGRLSRHGVGKEAKEPTAHARPTAALSHMEPREGLELVSGRGKTYCPGY